MMPIKRLCLKKIAFLVNIKFGCLLLYKWMVSPWSNFLASHMLAAKISLSAA